MLRYLLLLAFITTPLLILGQESDDGSTLLPDIDPQDIEVRGDFNARFPGLSRQPILGFNPKPRVFQLDPDRMPYIESEEDARSNISSSNLEQPISPSRERMHYPEQAQLFGRLGLGNHESPDARFYGETELSENSVASGDFNFLSSASYLPDELSSFRYFNGRTDWIRRENNSKLQVGLTGRSDFNHAVPGAIHAGNLDNYRKDYRKLGTHASYRHLNNAYNGWDLKAGYHYFQVEDGSPLAFSDEHYGRMGARYFWDGRRMEEQFSIELKGEGSFYNTFEEHNLSWYITQLNAFYKRNLLNSNFSAGVDVFHAYDDVDEPISLYIFPNLKFHYTGFQGGEVEFAVKSFVENSGLEGVHLDNTQLLKNPMIQNEQGLRFTANSQYDLFRGARIFGELNYDGYGSYAYYTLDDDGYSLNYDDDTNIFEATAGLSYDFIPQLLTLYSDVTWRNSNTSEDQPVPFLESFKSTASLYSNPISNLYLRAWTEYRGSRPINFTEEEMDGYFLFGAQIDFQITDNFGAYIKGLNLLNQDYEIWQGYQERPAQVYGGLTLHF
ncbi:MAG: hypothetical protein WEB89_07450 [Balneolales bacterium]